MSDPEDAAFVRAKLWALAKLCLAVVLALTTWFSATAVMPQLKEHWAVTGAQAVWLAVAVQLGFVVGAVVSAVASLSDIVPPRRLMAMSCLALSLVNALLLVAGTANQAIGLRIVTGVLLAGVYPPAIKFISTWFRTGRGIALGCVIGALALGSAAPHALNALGGANWRDVIVATSTASAVAACLFLLALRDGPHAFPSARFRPSEVRAALADRDFLLCTAGYVGHMWELYAMWSWLLFFVSNRLVALGHPDPALASMLTFVIIAAGTPGCIVAGGFADKAGRPLTTIVLMAVSGLCAATIGLAYLGAGWVFLALGLVWGATVVADSAQFSAIITESGQRFVGTALTVQMGAGYAATIVAVLVLPKVAAAFDGWRWAFLVLVPGPLLGSLAMATLARRRRADVDPEPRRMPGPVAQSDG